MKNNIVKLLLITTIVTPLLGADGRETLGTMESNPLPITQEEGDGRGLLSRTYAIPRDDGPLHRTYATQATQYVRVHGGLRTYCTIGTIENMPACGCVCSS